MVMVVSSPTTTNPRENTKVTATDGTSSTERYTDEVGSALPASQISLERRVAAFDSLGRCMRMLQELSRLPANWDSYGALPPSQIAIAVAQQLIDLVYSTFERAPVSKIQPTIIAPLADGGVQIEWAVGTRSAEIQVGSEGNLGYLLVDRSAPEVRYTEGESASWGTILNYLAAIILAN